jgi:hypothetical protein
MMPFAPLSQLYGRLAQLERARRVLVGDTEATLDEYRLEELQRTAVIAGGRTVTYSEGARRALTAYHSLLQKAAHRAQLFEPRDKGYAVPNVLVDELRVYWQSTKGHHVWIGMNHEGQWRVELELDGEASGLAAGGEALRSYWLLGLFPPAGLATNPTALHNAVAGLLIHLPSPPRARFSPEAQIEALVAHLGIDVEAAVRQILDPSVHWDDPAGWIAEARRKTVR